MDFVSWRGVYLNHKSRRSNRTISLFKFIGTTIYKKLNNDEDKITTILIADINTLDKKTGGIGLNPVNRFEDIERSEPLTENISASEIKIKYIGEK